MLQQSTATEHLRLTIEALPATRETLLATLLDELQMQAARIDELERWRLEMDEERDWSVSQIRHLQHLEARNQDLEEKYRWFTDGM